MPISEAQLETWSHQGSVQQSSSTYAAIKAALEKAAAPYSNRSFEIFLQGSYGNDTNVWADSDVDVVMCLTDSFYKDLSQLPISEQQAFERTHTNATYGHQEFKREVREWLEKCYPGEVYPGSKAITIRASGNRREADVLPCLKFRRYVSFKDTGDQVYREGIAFWPASGGLIENFPKQHSSNCTEKHKEVNSRFKPMVRIWKNMRNTMIAKGYIRDGLAPSYFIEGMLWNVPSGLYSGSYAETLEAALKWINNSEKQKLVCANRLHWLLRDNSPTSWKPGDHEDFMKAVSAFWTKGS